LREEEAIAGAILQRLTVSRDALTEEEQRAAQAAPRERQSATS
jgi:chromosome segregation protein